MSRSRLKNKLKRLEFFSNSYYYIIIK